MSFASLGLPDSLLSALDSLGYAAATPIQERVIPLVREGKDVLAAAQTGSGKTAAFALPLLQRLGEAEERPVEPRALALVPTRELAVQVGKAFERYGKDLPRPVRVLTAFGGVGYEAQMKTAYEGVDVVVATPGRLIDLEARAALSLSRIETLVLDEADRLLALGFADELEAILARLPARRQNLLFSATFPPSVMALAKALLSDPEEVRLESAARPVEQIAQRAIEVERDRRTALLRHLLESEKWERVLVFVGSKRRADNVTAKLLKRGIRAAALHGNLSQEKRAWALERFKQGKTQVLMATDVASRGIDIVQLPCVVNYDLPRAAADYVHRIGRTGRAGEPGQAVTFVSQEDHHAFELIQKRIGWRVDRERVAGFEPPVWDPEAASPKGKAPVKGKRKSKKDKRRERAAPQESESGEQAAGEPLADPWARAARGEGRKR